MSEVKPPYEKALEMLYEKNAEITDLRTRLEKAENVVRERACCIPTNGWGHTDNCLHTRLEKAEKEARMNKANNIACIRIREDMDRKLDEYEELSEKLDAENAVLKQKLERITAWANTDTYLYDHKAIQNITIAKETGYKIAQKIVREILSW